MSDVRMKKASPDPPGHKLSWMKQIIGELGTNPGFVLARLPLVGELIAAALPINRPPILVISLPRAGSSWVGRILGASEASLYLREPMTQSYLRHGGLNQTPIFEWGMCRDSEAYDRFAALTFKGIPRFDKAIVPYPRQWTFFGRTGKRLVVKEVNPLVLDRLYERFQPKVLYLVRHPAAVARSFQSLGWTGDQFSARFLPQTLDGFEREHSLPRQAGLWEQAGAFQAIAQNLISGFLSKIDHRVVRYEDICEDPISVFGRIFDFCHLPFSGAVRNEIERSSRSMTNYAPGNYDTMRNSIEMKDRWKRDIDPADIEKVRRGYFAYRPVFYNEESEW